jgi:hypothetical protein
MDSDKVLAMPRRAMTIASTSITYTTARMVFAAPAAVSRYLARSSTLALL